MSKENVRDARIRAKVKIKYIYENAQNTISLKQLKKTKFLFMFCHYLVIIYE